MLEKFASLLKFWNASKAEREYMLWVNKLHNEQLSSTTRIESGFVVHQVITRVKTMYPNSSEK